MALMMLKALTFLTTRQMLFQKSRRERERLFVNDEGQAAGP
jgi:hypothetical protein